MPRRCCRPRFPIRVACVAGLAAALGAEDWSRFRGADGRGVGSGAGYPSELSTEKNLLWRTTLREGKSSPVLTPKHIFLTSFESGKLYTHCLDRATGALVWERAVDRPREEFANALNHPAAITPVTDGENVYAFFKDYGFVSYDSAGNLRWKTPMGPFNVTMGLGASPVLTADSVILVADQVEGSFIAALDKRNGELRWKTGRDEGEAWGTPLYYRPSGAAPHVVTISRGQFGAHAAATGERTSSEPGLLNTIVASPVLDNDTIYVLGYGSDAPAPFATRLAKLDRNGDGKLGPDEYGTDAFLRGIGHYVGNRDGIITEEEWLAKQRQVMGPNGLMALRLETREGTIHARVLWSYDRSFTGVIPSPLVYGGVVYTIRNGGILTTLDSATGKVIKTARVEGALGGYSASPVAAEDKIYFASEEGVVTVLRAGGEWEVLSRVDLDEPIFATPALSQGRLFIRTARALYCFGERAPEVRTSGAAPTAESADRPPK